MKRSRRGVTVLALGLSLMVLLVACTGSNGTDPQRNSVGTDRDGNVAKDSRSGQGGAAGAGDELGSGAGYIDPAAWKARQDHYLKWATREGLAKGSFGSILANAERAAREPGHQVDLTAAKGADFSKVWAKLDAFEDTGDFDINAMLFVYANYRDKLDPSLVQALEKQFLSFKYWWTEPTPPGVIDSQYYWTENHQIIFLANELVAGQLFPDKTFTNSGMTGRQHVEHAKPLIERWIDLRSRFGWSEWLSNVYYGEDFEGLLLIAEHSDDLVLARKASMAIDLLLFEIASHTQNGAFGATHGRSYMKDKMTALDEDNFTLSKLLFDDTTHDYQHNDVAVLLAIAHRYRPPEVLRKVAKSDEVSIDKLRASLPMDPTAPVTPNPVAPHGFTYTDPENLMVWWGIGAQFSWPIVPLSVDTLKKYNLWESDNFQQAKELEPIIQASTIPQLQELGWRLAKPLNPGLLSEVNTYTWRSPEVMLSTAQDWRAGQRGEQDHIWQATIDANAQVFAQHPSKPVPDGDDWHTNSGYWTGDGAMPRSAQFENVNVSIYAPQYASGTGSTALSYLDFTHAYFPQDHFDEVVQKPATDGGNWTIGRKGDGYIALYSKRPTRWAEYDGVTHPTRGMKKPFDLIADGGPDNVWLTEVGRASEWKSKGPDAFTAFVEAVAGAKIDVQRLTTEAPPGALAGYTVAYESPTRGLVEFGGNTSGTGQQPFKVKGTEIALHDYPRYDNPWAKVPFDTTRYRIEAGGSTLELDFSAGTRTAT